MYVLYTHTDSVFAPCGGLNENGPDKLIKSGIVRGVALLA